LTHSKAFKRGWLVVALSRAVDLTGFVWNPTFEADLTSFKFK